MSTPSTDETTRRRVLEATGALTTALLAGCRSRSAPGATTSHQTGTRSETSEPTDGEGTETPGSAAADGTWPRFGFDRGNSGHAPAVSGPDTDATVEWRYDAGTPTLNASPVVGDGVVYVPGSGDPGLVHAVDAATGETVWEFEPAGYATCAPALVNGALYFGTWGKQFYAVDAESGEPRWSRDVGHRFGQSSPAVVDGTVYVGTIGDGPLVVSGPEDEEQFEACAFLALDAETGDLQWQYREFDERDNVESSPAVADGRVYFGGEEALYALDAATGEVAWTRDVPTHPESSPAVVDGVVYYGAPVLADDESAPPARVLALHAASGETLWRAPIDDTSLRTSPAVADGTVYVAASSMRVCYGAGGETPNCSGVTRGQLYALDAATGERRWTAPIHTDTRSSPAVADGVVYVGCSNGISAVTTDGENAWRVDFGNDREDPPYVKSSPAVADGRVFIGASDGHLRAIGDG